MVLPVLNYVLEISGFHKSPDIEKIHLKFLKQILGVRTSTASAAVYGEFGRVYLIVQRKTRILKYWYSSIQSGYSGTTFGTPPQLLEHHPIEPWGFWDNFLEHHPNFWNTTSSSRWDSWTTFWNTTPTPTHRRNNENTNRPGWGFWCIFLEYHPIEPQGHQPDHAQHHIW